ncbi:MAG: hypothetical protein KAT17_00425 [Candidatus Aminicenantes bacterium]|nr:hypothetical protein [Candidatus Aminicenantes bacterium]
MKSKYRAFLILIVLLATCLAATPEEQGEHHFNWGHFIGSVLNSTILFGGLIIFLRKPLIKLLTQRSLDIKNDMVEREKNLKTASREFEKISMRLDKIESEVQEMNLSAQQKGEEEKQKIEKLGEQESQRVLNLTEAEIKNRVESSMTRLKSKIARLTIDHFKKEIESQLDEETHRRLIDRNITIAGEVIEKEKIKREKE